MPRNYASWEALTTAPLSSANLVRHLLITAPNPTATTPFDLFGAASKGNVTPYDDDPPALVALRRDATLASLAQLRLGLTPVSLIRDDLTNDGRVGDASLRAAAAARAAARRARRPAPPSAPQHHAIYAAAWLLTPKRSRRQLGWNDVVPVSHEGYPHDENTTHEGILAWKARAHECKAHLKRPPPPPSPEHLEVYAAACTIAMAIGRPAPEWWSFPDAASSREPLLPDPTRVKARFRTAASLARPTEDQLAYIAWDAAVSKRPKRDAPPPPPTALFRAEYIRALRLAVEAGHGPPPWWASSNNDVAQPTTSGLPDPAALQAAELPADNALRSRVLESVLKHARAELKGLNVECPSHSPVDDDGPEDSPRTTLPLRRSARNRNPKY